MATIRQKDRKTGVVYVYEAVSTYHPELKQSRSKRVLIGKVDPDSDKVVPCGKRGRPRKIKAPEEGLTATADEVKRLQSRVTELSLEKSSLEGTIREQKNTIQQLQITISKLQSRMSYIRHYANDSID